ncbi:hypothetical protein MHPYR_320049 [uncultured Mycobacterium sp.]|uniref:Uncharacterized protein n=1 Tax=uncultured Mycobacterium sp. TaxID=171292 RepID=A0A1Y5PJY2_9MYCO|nr:hypothetical protein MHPYR_300029 [uncultured Mycobacterium sp.]SBS76471.1 hypothetical protein MHPYR_320049 [uncultured Mycobacterium sp.]
MFADGPAHSQLTVATHGQHHGGGHFVGALGGDVQHDALLGSDGLLRQEPLHQFVHAAVDAVRAGQQIARIHGEQLVHIVELDHHIRRREPLDRHWRILRTKAPAPQSKSEGDRARPAAPGHLSHTPAGTRSRAAVLRISARKDVKSEIVLAATVATGRALRLVASVFDTMITLSI